LVVVVVDSADVLVRHAVGGRACAAVVVVMVPAAAAAAAAAAAREAFARAHGRGGGVAGCLRSSSGSGCGRG
jgi:hypothetical protein